MKPTRHLALALLTGVVALAGCGGGGGGSSTPPPPPPAAPTITTQPLAQTVNAGDPVTFSVVATGATAYQWQRNGAAVSGATGASYTLSPTTTANNGDAYTVVASNAGGSATSSAAALRVTGVSVIAGQLGGTGYADGPVSQARFWGPAALALDAAGNLYVADYNAIRKIAPASGATPATVSTIAGVPRTCGAQLGTGSAALLCYPVGLALGPDGGLYVPEDYNFNAVLRIDPATLAVTQYSAGLNCAGPLAFAGATLYAIDTCTAPPGVFSVAANVATAFSATGSQTSAIAVDAAQNLLVATGTQLSLIAPGGAVTALAGSSTVGSADGTGAAAQFGCAFDTVGPNYFTDTAGIAGVAAGSGGVYYAADYCNNTIRKITSGGGVSTLAGQAGSAGEGDGTGAAARFWGPSAMVADPAGNLYVADYLNGLIRKVTPAGAVSTYAGQASHAGYANGSGAAAAFRYPGGIAADSAGNLYVADTYNSVIRKITPAGSVSNYAGTPGQPGMVNAGAALAQFNQPRAVAVDSAGNVYVADTGNRMIRRIDASGTVTTLATLPVGGSQSPRGVAVTATGAIYCTSSQGVFLVTGGTANQIAALAGASAITAGSDGRLYVSARLLPSDSVSAVTLAGTTTTITSTGLGNVTAIVLAGDGNLYVADRDSSVIRQIVPATGVTTTVVGSTALPLGAALGGLPARLGGPTGLALLSTGTHVSLAVTESYEHSVLRVDLP